MTSSLSCCPSTWNCLLCAVCHLITWFPTTRGQMNQSDANYSNNKALSREYCDTELFRPTCADTEVILISSALYGRMKLGRCVELGMGHVGCQADVLIAVDRRCSGRRLCEIHVPDAELKKTRPCLGELKTYLDIAYQCIKVETVTEEFCRDHTDLPVTEGSNHGYIASIVTSDLPQCDGTRHPWIVTALPGQRINLTLYDFSIDQSTTASGRQIDRGSSSRNKCRRYALLRDAASPDQTITLCGTDARISHVYLSTSHVVRIWITAGLGPRDLQRFLIEYRVMGCPDPNIPSNVWFQRTADGHGMVGCHRRDVSGTDYVKRNVVTWRIVCGTDNKWTTSLTSSGLFQNCSTPSTMALERNKRPTVDKSQNGFLLLLTVAIVGIVLILVVMCITIVAFKSRTRRQTISGLYKPNHPAVVLGQNTMDTSPRHYWPTTNVNDAEPRSPTTPATIPCVSSRVADQWAVRPSSSHTAWRSVQRHQTFDAIMTSE